MAVHLKKRAYEEFSHVIQEHVEPKEKTIKLSKKPLTPDLVRLNLVGKPSDRVLFLLARFAKKLPIPLHSVHECIKTLFKRFSTEKESDVRARIIWLIGQLCFTVGYDSNPILHDLILLLNKDSSGKVLVQCWETVVQLAEKIDDSEIHQQLTLMAKKNLSDSRHQIRSKCLMTIGTLGANKITEGVDGKGNKRGITTNLHSIIALYFTDSDSRVRCNALSALISMHHRGQKLELTAYDQACKAMRDDYEHVRFTASQLVWVLGHLYPENKVRAAFADEDIRLVDDAFAKICNLVNDSSWKVRAEAAKLLGSLHRVSDSFVFQTLDKKLMSDLKRKKSLNEQAKEGFVEEFSSGKTWSDDAPVTRDLNIETTTVMNSGACGAFVHGLEDEMMEVRSAAVDSLTELAAQSSNASFAQRAVDFLVDCLNDEIEAVRLNAVTSIHKIVDQVVILEDQLDNVHSAMEDACPEIRHGIHELLSSCRLQSKACLYDTVDRLLKNLNKYPNDRQSIWKTTKKLGEHHGELTYLLTSQLLSIHAFFHSSEPQMDDPNYIAVLILVFNAAMVCPQMTQLFPEHVTRHYQYLSDSIPHLVPQGLKMMTFTSNLCTTNTMTSSNHESCDTSNKSRQFLSRILERINNLQNQDTSQQKLILTSAINDLKNISKFAPKYSSTADCMADFLQAQLLLYKSVDQKTWTNKIQGCSENLLQPVALRIIELTYELEYLYIGLSCYEISLIRQLRFKAQVLLFVLDAQEYNKNNNNKGKKDVDCGDDYVGDEETLHKSCDELFVHMRNLHDYMKEHNLLQTCDDSFTKTCFNQLLNKMGMKPSLLIKFFQPLLSNYVVSDVQLNNTVQKARVVIHQPIVNNDVVMTFTSGLATPINFRASVENIIDPIHHLSIQIKYGDSTIQRFPLRTNDVRKISSFKHEIATTVQLSHVKWTGACDVHISLVRVITNDHVTNNDVNITQDNERILQLGKIITIAVQTK